MDWPEALEFVVARTSNEHYRLKCADANPRNEAWRREMIRQADELMNPQPPPLAARLRTATGAAVHAAAAFVAGQPVLVDAAEFDRRLAICRGCEYYFRRDDRCSVCGCVARWKTRLAQEHCPLSEPRW
jgi:hypothetical protein